MCVGFVCVCERERGLVCMAWFVGVGVYVCRYTYIYILIYAYAYVYMYVYKHIYAHKPMHTFLNETHSNMIDAQRVRRLY